MNVKVGTRAKFHVYRGNVSPLWGEKPISVPLSKNNTGMAVLRAGMPVVTFWSTAGARPTIPTILGMVIEEVRPIFAPPNFFVVSPLGATENCGKSPHRGKILL